MYKLDLIPEEKRAGYEKRKFEKTIALIVSYLTGMKNVHYTFEEYVQFS